MRPWLGAYSEAAILAQSTSRPATLVPLARATARQGNRADDDTRTTVDATADASCAGNRGTPSASGLATPATLVGGTAENKKKLLTGRPPRLFP